jgi:hypothetical protein
VQNLWKVMGDISSDATPWRKYSGEKQSESEREVNEAIEEVPYQEATYRWLAARLHIHWTTITKVDFGLECGRCGLSCECEMTEPIISVHADKLHYIYPDGKFTLGGMLQGIAEIAVSLVSPSPTGIRSLQDEASNAYQEAKQARIEQDQMREELQKVIRTARSALTQHVSALEWLGQGVE